MSLRDLQISLHYQVTKTWPCFVSFQQHRNYFTNSYLSSGWKLTGVFFSVKFWLNVKFDPYYEFSTGVYTRCCCESNSINDLRLALYIPFRLWVRKLAQTEKEWEQKDKTCMIRKDFIIDWCTGISCQRIIQLSRFSLKFASVATAANAAPAAALVIGQDLFKVATAAA